ncbi:hypothetical protein E8E15_003004 [Penicillium rubens]|uniref:Pc21g20600 protein n=2 Tax=Penicillium chrysogenum species complex TaxID=254878 RepID=B6HL10_PENRW|nr:uncharacterized protein N7525_006490 [Penicillium rubens]KAF3019071.1 hypothetical protein E8E15_003004 [Penicillium rubens]KAJ5828237.1 hypothetical protein N7525_006490 [Penicillium rubens]KZN89593.1 Guanine nucleotide-binding protein negative regulator [Penicillium chrysogenum]CAP96957.1 Pc21g20600 [Penicillium rubens Wisconsin 54-1255]
MAEENAKAWTPVCVASSGRQSARPIDPTRSRLASSPLSTVQSEPGATSDNESIDQDTDLGYFKSAEWTPDGTTLLTDSADHSIRTWILPPDLLEDKPIHQISPYSTLPSAEPTYATAIYPFYDLQDPSSTLFLSSVRDHPIRLSSALAPTSVASYSLVNPMTEAFITPHSMIYPSTMGGTHFLTGSDSLICLFDVSRTGPQGPISSMPTIPSKRKQIVGGGIGMKGIVSALALNPSGDGILAAGTFTRHVGLYSSNGSGELLGTFSVAKTSANRDIGGRGVTQLVWSPCGRYLYVVERKSDGILVYDVRVTGQLLGHLRGRKAYTNQRMKVDVVPSGPDGSHEIWAGGTDGFMRVWRSPEHCAGGKDPDWEFKVHDDAVTSTMFHPMGSVAATCSGQRHFVSDDPPDEEVSAKNTKQTDISLKVWSMPFLLSETEKNHDLDSVS